MNLKPCRHAGMLQQNYATLVDDNDLFCHRLHHKLLHLLSSLGVSVKQPKQYLEQRVTHSRETLLGDAGYVQLVVEQVNQ